MERLALHIESLIFSSEHTISLAQIKTCVEETLDQTYKNVEIKKALDVLIEKYNSEEFSFEIVEIASGFKFLTKGSYHNTVSTLIKKNNQKRLSKAALETLAIIAYKQPVTKSDVEGIRGVNADYTIQKLLEKELVAIAGRGDGPGRPLLYTTSDKFMDYFGIKDVGSLPKLKDLKVPEIQIGEPAPIEEDYVESVEDKDDQAATNPTEEAIDNTDLQEDTNPTEEATAEVATDDANDQEDTIPTEEAIAEIAVDEAVGDIDDQEDTNPTEEAIDEAIAEVAIDDTDNQEANNSTEDVLAEASEDLNESPETTDTALDSPTDSEPEVEEVVGQSADQSENGIVITEADPEPIDRVLVKEGDHLTNTKLSNEEE